MNKARWTLLGMVLLALALAEVPMLRWPFRLLETFFHELSHGLIAILTGGEIVRIQLLLFEGGLCVHRGGIRLFTAFAGYFGAVFWGVAIYLAASAASRRNAMVMAGLLAATVGLSTLLWMRDPISIVIGALLTGLFMLAVKWGDLRWSRPFLQFSGIYVLIQAIRSPVYLLHPAVGKGDSDTLAGLTLIPEFIWVGIWVLCGLFGLYFLWKHAGNGAAFGKGGRR